MYLYHKFHNFSTIFIYEYNTCRGEQIQAVLDSRKDVDKYVIIDDDSDFLPHQLPYHVKTEVSVGFTQQEFKLALEILLK